MSPDSRRTSSTSRTPRTSRTSRATYVYCILRAPRRPSLARMPAGPPGARPVRLLDLKPGHYLAVSDVPLSQYGEAPLVRRLSQLDWVSRVAVAHGAVIERFIGADAVLPMKLLTIFMSDERAVQQIAGDWKHIGPRLDRIAAHLEWGVRLVGGDAPARRPDARTRPASGRAYLMAKRQEKADRTTGKQRARMLADRLFQTLRRGTRDARQRDVVAPAEGGRVWLDAAFLVPTSGASRFRALVGRQARKLAVEGCDVQLSGPWPPYSFVEEPR